MQEILREIQTGEFAREWMLENMVNRPMFTALTRADEEHLIEEIGRGGPLSHAPVPEKIISFFRPVSGNPQKYFCFTILQSGTG